MEENQFRLNSSLFTWSLKDHVNRINQSAEKIEEVCAQVLCKAALPQRTSASYYWPNENKCENSLFFSTQKRIASSIIKLQLLTGTSITKLEIVVALGKTLKLISIDQAL